MDGKSLQDCGLVDGSVLTLVKKRMPAILTASRDRTAKLWSIATGECTHTFFGHAACVNSVVFSEDGSAVLTASEDNTAKYWSTAIGECTQTFAGHSDCVNAAVLSRDGLAVLTASDDRTAKLWSTATGECTQTFSGHSVGCGQR